MIRQTRNLAQDAAPATRELATLLSTMRKTGGFQGLMETIFGLGGTRQRVRPVRALRAGRDPDERVLRLRDPTYSRAAAHASTPASTASALRALAQTMREPVDTGRDRTQRDEARFDAGGGQGGTADTR